MPISVVLGASLVSSFPWHRASYDEKWDNETRGSICEQTPAACLLIVTVCMKKDMSTYRIQLH